MTKFYPLWWNPWGDRGLDLNKNVSISIDNLDCDERATISFDAQSSVSASEGVSLRVKKHENFVHLIHPKGYDYFEIIRSKLHWGQKV